MFLFSLKFIILCKLQEMWHNVSIVHSANIAYCILEKSQILNILHEKFII